MQKFVLVPVEPTERMVGAGSWGAGPGGHAHTKKLARKAYAAMLAAAPQPPALGGKPKILAFARDWFAEGEVPKKEKNNNGRLAWPKKFLFKELTPNRVFHTDYPLISLPAHQAHVARLQADVEQLTQRYDAVITDRNEVGSALEKAQSRIAELEGLLRKGVTVVEQFMQNVAKCSGVDFQTVNEFLIGASRIDAALAEGAKS